MRIRIKFTKNESVKYLGHLDIMRTFQRCFNRANIKMTYSEGFNPHQKMNFASPLGVGIASRGEYLDAVVADGQDPEVICSSLDNVCGDGFDIIAVRILEDNAEKVMAAVRYASYEITFYEYIDLHIDRYIDRDSIIISKKTKTGIKEVDAKKSLINISQEANVLRFTVSAGGDSSIKSDLLAADILAFNGLLFSRDMVSIVRTELYNGDLIPLIDHQTI